MCSVLKEYLDPFKLYTGVLHINIFDKFDTDLSVNFAIFWNQVKGNLPC